MTFFAHFALAFGALLACLALVAAWVFRTSSAPLILKLMLPGMLVGLACAAPFEVSSMMGFPVVEDVAALPDQFELIAFAPHDDAGLVDLWLCTQGGVPRAYETALDDKTKKTLREAKERLAHGLRVMLVRRGQNQKASAQERFGDRLAIGDDGSSYAIDDKAFQSPSKERE